MCHILYVVQLTAQALGRFDVQLGRKGMSRERCLTETYEVPVILSFAPTNCRSQPTGGEVITLDVNAILHTCCSSIRSYCSDEHLRSFGTHAYGARLPYPNTPLTCSDVARYQWILHTAE